MELESWQTTKLQSRWTLDALLFFCTESIRLTAGQSRGSLELEEARLASAGVEEEPEDVDGTNVRGCEEMGGELSVNVGADLCVLSSSSFNRS